MTLCLDKDLGEVQVHTFDGMIHEIGLKYGLCILGGSLNRVAPESFEMTPWRRFEFYSISQLLNGYGKLQFDSRSEQELSPGDVVLVTPGTLNRYGGNHKYEYEEDTILFRGPVVDRFFEASQLSSGVYHMGTARCLKTILDVSNNPSLSSQINANLLLQSLWGEIFNRSNRYDNSLEPINDLLRLLQSRQERWWTVTEMAELCGLAEGRFRRLFYKVTGTHPKKYLEQQKLRKAAELLLSTNDNLSQIAAALGYVDHYHFARRFKIYFGYPPGTYRKRLMN